MGRSEEECSSGDGLKQAWWSCDQLCVSCCRQVKLRFVRERIVSMFAGTANRLAIHSFLAWTKKELLLNNLQPVGNLLRVKYCYVNMAKNRIWHAFSTRVEKFAWGCVLCSNVCYSGFIFSLNRCPCFPKPAPLRAAKCISFVFGVGYFEWRSEQHPVNKRCVLSIVPLWVVIWQWSVK